ncbi:M48 family metallopeptidase [Pseudaeromonas sp. ZJS20]|uniref:M48 metallopeptidase family protein n=1 Tax=Pseudaeromonas aegiceratis TaxID=3153928 RepID=UPI00390CD755
MTALPFLAGYPDSLLHQVRSLIDQDRLGPWLRQKYPPDHHAIQSDKALFGYVQALKQQYMKSAPPLSGVSYDSKINLVKHALGLHLSHSRVQGSRLKSKSSIQIASLFREAPAPFLRMIAVHELAHLRHKEHDKAFYQLCCHMEPDYHQLELDLRLYLTQQSLERGQ